MGELLSQFETREEAFFPANVVIMHGFTCDLVKFTAF